MKYRLDQDKYYTSHKDEQSDRMAKWRRKNPEYFRKYYQRMKNKLKNT